MMGRFFSEQERAALYLAADGRCADCGSELGAGWHTDHVMPWSAGGATDVVNGQALCARCNVEKGAGVPDRRYEWQQRAEAEFFASEAQDFLVCATPGAGKTRFALACIARALHVGLIQRVAVIVPSDALRTQWADEASTAGIQLCPATESTSWTKPGYQGFVATYQQLAQGAGADLARRAVGGMPTLAVIDEIHHAGDRAAWGRGLQHALGPARRRLSLTGTPWRSDPNSPIPFVRYGADGRVSPEFRYEYGDAVADGVCRAVEFHAYDGDGRWVDCGDVRLESLSDAEDDDVPPLLAAVYDPRGPWIRGILETAASTLSEVRSDVPDAGGLVVADDVFKARAYASILSDITRETVPVAVSEDADAHLLIERFRKDSGGRWLVAVRMVSEGVDIPRLAVGVYASTIRTPLFFRQVVGRFVRQRGDEELNARLFLPAIPQLQVHAREIEEELRHQLELAVARTEERRERAGDSDRDDWRRTILGSSDPALHGVTLRGDPLAVDEVRAAAELCAAYGVPRGHAPGVARILRAQGARPNTPAHAPSATRDVAWRDARLLRLQAKTLTGRIAYRLAAGERASVKVHAKEVNKLVMRDWGFPPRAKCSNEQLRQLVQRMEQWMASL